jgi:S1-C subfamily serine protease
MPFQVTCTACGRAYRLDDDFKSGKVVCKECRTAFVVMPPPPTSGVTRSAPRPAPSSADRSVKRDRAEAPPRQGSALPWILGGLAVFWFGLVLLTGVLAAVFWVGRGKDNPADPVAGSSATASVVDKPVPSKDDPPGKKEAPAKEAEERPSVPEPRAPRGGLSAPALKHLKGATVFLKVDAGRLSCTGSGFLCKLEGDTGYLITNHHVVNPEAELLQPVRVRRGRTTVTGVRFVRYRPKDVRISAVFNSGTKQERVLQADVLATDESRDLAVLRIKGGMDWPRPIILDEKVKPLETMPVYILGFPFGEALSLKKGNPAITINKGSVSSLRENEYGQMKAVQIDGAINPGNSGGPVVDEEGHLLGVAVATVRGSGIGLAIAPDELTRMFQGRVGGVALNAKKVESALAEYEVNMHLIDPMKQIKSVTLLCKATDTPATKLGPNADGTFPALEGGQRVDLKIEDQQATGTVTLNRTPGASRFMLFQACYVAGSGQAVYTEVSSSLIRMTGGPTEPPVRPTTPGSPTRPRRPDTAPPTGGLGGGATTVGDISFKEVLVKAGQVARHILWAPDGKAFYVLEKDTGVLRKIAVDGFKEIGKIDLETPCNWMTMSAEGIVVAANSIQEVYVVDPVKLTRKQKIPAPKVSVVASAPALSVAFASSEGRFAGDGELSVLDLKKGEISRQYTARDLTTKLIGFQEPIATPDGKYLFTRGGIEQLHRFKIKGTTLTYEESSERIAQNGQAIEVSPDSKWVSLPSGGGNYGAGPYGTFIYSVTNLSSPPLTIRGGAYPRAMGFDPKLGYVYTQNFTNQLILFTSKGVKLKEFPLRGAGDVRQFVPHPAGGSLLLLTDKKLFHVVVKKDK